MDHQEIPITNHIQTLDIWPITFINTSNLCLFIRSIFVFGVLGAEVMVRMMLVMEVAVIMIDGGLLKYTCEENENRQQPVQLR